ncbi:hypothetical protein [Fluviicola chungangensis]|uniref:RHS repeat protein n=1 Tax=Fluviicola chungangensis TaxID=2597671 RepID=A0A556N317_9FLAO|nr:hypothetical protein [Fluviicola chungangensis]TSJ46562.1 hypothetical protein FO442_05225 [Fluviicola chungangensis]
MKTIRLILIISLLLSVFTTNSQTYFHNYSVNEPLSICGKTSVFEGLFDNANDFECVGGQSKMYCSFSPAQNHMLGTSLTLKYSIEDPSSGLANINSSYKIYGPFGFYGAPAEDFAVLISNGTAPILETGVSTTGIRTFNGLILADHFYVVEIVANTCYGRLVVETQTADFPCSSKKVVCTDCIPKFQPVEDQYVVSAWVREVKNSGNSNAAINYTSQLKLTSGALTPVILTPSGQIIDGWQRIEGVITTNNVGNLKMELIVTDNTITVYYDDIRVFPYDGSMITYVYDPVTLRLAAELDERNYAKIYEYDEEGKLIRVKKETEKGIMTIQENRENSSKEQE